MGPYEIVRIEEKNKLEYVRIDERDPRPFNFSQAKHYIYPNEQSPNYFETLLSALNIFC